MSYRILFVPVSSPEGVGEYMRSLMIAQSLASQDRNLKIQFILSEKAPYADDCPFETHLCPGSPTLHSEIVNTVIENFKPNIVIFDASGRVSQLRSAKYVGAHTIFIAQHDKKLAKGLKWGRLKYTDAIFVVQPEALMKPLSLLQKLKLQLLSKALPKFVGPVFPRVNHELQERLLVRYSLARNNFILICAGGGTHIINGKTADELFSKATKEICEKTSEQCLLIHNKTFEEDSSNNSFINSNPLPPEEFVALMDAAKFAILGGGDSLLQALALNASVICVPIAKDQHERIERCDRLFSITKCNTEVNSIVGAAIDNISKASDKKNISNEKNLGMSVIMRHIQSTLAG